MTPVFHRFGYYETLKLNLKQFVDFKFQQNQWYQIDVLLEWESRNVALFIDGTERLTTPFFSKARDDLIEKDLQKCESQVGVNTLSLYSLTPNVTSSFHSVRLCTELCPDVDYAS